MKFIKLNENDNVQICVVESSKIFKFGHKYATQKILAGEPIIKYGREIGIASCEINEDDQVHVQNLELLAYEFDKKIEPYKSNTDFSQKNIVNVENGKFSGFYNPYNNSVATRKRLIVLSTVNCANFLVDKASQEFKTSLLSGVDEVELDIISITHNYGCGNQSEDENLLRLRQTLKGFIANPNCFGAVIIGLGCEDNQVKSLYNELGKYKETVLWHGSIQEFSHLDEIIKLIKPVLKERIDSVLEIKPKEFSTKHLVVALQCGGSDGFSGLTANPILGGAIDLLVSQGGSAILSETPEIIGAEDLLLSRIKEDNDSKKFFEIIKKWQIELEIAGLDFNGNPSPGNLEGGLTTIIEKSLGAIQKGGTSDVVEVLNYGEQVSADISGLRFMDSPGYDPCSITGQIASGANIICFTTGRGAIYGNGLMPVVKISSNSKLAKQMAQFIDYDAYHYQFEGHDKGFEHISESLFQLILSIASRSSRSASEKVGMRDVNFTPWHKGVTL